jgi:hypothetical protein
VRSLVRAVGALAFAAFWLAGACGSGPPARTLLIESLGPACPGPGEIVTIVISGTSAPACGDGAIVLGQHELLNLGAAPGTPGVLIARLPRDYAPSGGDLLKLTCGTASATAPWSDVCPIELDAGPVPGDAATNVESSPACAQAVEAIIEAVDDLGHAFPRDPDGAYQVPAVTRDFSFDATRSRNVSGPDTSYTFSSDCYPRVTVNAPVLGGLSVEGWSTGRRCGFTVEIADRGCGRPRLSRAAGSFTVVP